MTIFNRNVNSGNSLVLNSNMVGKSKNRKYYEKSPIHNVIKDDIFTSSVTLDAIENYHTTRKFNATPAEYALLVKFSDPELERLAALVLQKNVSGDTFTVLRQLLAEPSIYVKYCEQERVATVLALLDLRGKPGFSNIKDMIIAVERVLGTTIEWLYRNPNNLLMDENTIQRFVDMIFTKKRYLQLYKMLTSLGDKIIECATTVNPALREAQFENALEAARSLVIHDDQLRRENPVQKEKDIFSLSNEKEFNRGIDRVYNTYTDISDRLITEMTSINCLTNGGFAKGRVYMFAGVAGCGKSILLLNILAQIRTANVNYVGKYPDKIPTVVYITLENSMEETVERFYNIVEHNGCGSDLPVNQRYVSSAFMKSELREKGCYVDDSTPIDILIMYLENRSISTDYFYKLYDDMLAEGREMICLMYDHVKRVRSASYESKNPELRLELGEVVNESKAFAIAKDIPVITVAHLNRGANTKLETINDQVNRGRKDINYNGLSESYIGESMLMHDNVDWFATISKLDLYQDRIIIRVTKSRDGTPPFFSCEQRFFSFNSIKLAEDRTSAKKSYSITGGNDDDSEMIMLKFLVRLGWDLYWDESDCTEDERQLIHQTYPLATDPTSSNSPCDFNAAFVNNDTIKFLHENIRKKVGNRRSRNEINQFFYTGTTIEEERLLAIVRECAKSDKPEDKEKKTKAFSKVRELRGKDVVNFNLREWTVRLNAYEQAAYQKAQAEYMDPKTMYLADDTRRKLIRAVKGRKLFETNPATYRPFLIFEDEINRYTDFVQSITRITNDVLQGYLFEVGEIVQARRELLDLIKNTRLYYSKTNKTGAAEFNSLIEKIKEYEKVTHAPTERLPYDILITWCKMLAEYQKFRVERYNRRRKAEDEQEFMDQIKSGERENRLRKFREAEAKRQQLAEEKRKEEEARKLAEEERQLELKKTKEFEMELERRYGKELSEQLKQEMYEHWGKYRSAKKQALKYLEEKEEERKRLEILYPEYKEGSIVWCYANHVLARAAFACPYAYGYVRVWVEEDQRYYWGRPVLIPVDYTKLRNPLHYVTKHTLGFAEAGDYALRNPLKSVPKGETLESIQNSAANNQTMVEMMRFGF